MNLAAIPKIIGDIIRIRWRRYFVLPGAIAPLRNRSWAVKDYL
jgi:hypothetical protein